MRRSGRCRASSSNPTGACSPWDRASGSPYRCATARRLSLHLPTITASPRPIRLFPGRSGRSGCPGAPVVPVDGCAVAPVARRAVRPVARLPRWRRRAGRAGRFLGIGVKFSGQGRRSPPQFPHRVASSITPLAPGIAAYAIPATAHPTASKAATSANLFLRRNIHSPSRRPGVSIAPGEVTMITSGTIIGKVYGYLACPVDAAARHRPEGHAGVIVAGSGVWGVSPRRGGEAWGRRNESIPGTMDRHALWRRVRSDWEECKRRAPTGYEPVVEVYLAGLPEPMTPGFVQTSRDPKDPWVRFESEVTGVEASRATPMR